MSKLEDIGFYSLYDHLPGETDSRVKKMMVANHENS